MGRNLSQSSGAYAPNYNQNTLESNSSRFTCRCIYTTPGSYTFTVPSGVCSITAVAVGPGGCANCIVKLKERYIYRICEYINTIRYQQICQYEGVPCCNWDAFGCDRSGIVYASTCVNSGFNLSGHSSCSPCIPNGGYFRENFDSVYTQLDYALIDSAPGGGYSEKEISTTPGSTFSIVVGQYGGNNFSCINDQICSTGACIVNGSGISTDTQYTCFCGSESFYCCQSSIDRCESYTKSGPVCYIREKVVNSCLIPGCGYGGTINRTGGFGCKIQSFCFPLGFDNLNYDQCLCSIPVCNCCLPRPCFSISRNISICTVTVSDPTLSSLTVCPSDLVSKHTCYFPTRFYYCCNCTCWFCRGAQFRRNCFLYSDTISKNTANEYFCCCWSPMCNFLIPCGYCGTCFSACTNFIGLVTDITNSTNCILAVCNLGGGSSGGSPCFNGVYHSGSPVCILNQSTSDRPTITSCDCGRPVFTDGVCHFACLLQTRVYSTYNPACTELGYSAFALVANTGCNPCNCRDIGCFFCTCRFDIIKNMWGIVSGPQCFAFGATGIGNSLTLCDPLRFARSVGYGAICSFCGHCYFYSGCGYNCYLCNGQCVGTISYFGSSTCIPALYNSFYPCCRCDYAVTCICRCNGMSISSLVSTCFFDISCNGCCCGPTTNYWPTCKGYSCTGGVCSTGIPAFNLYELLCDSSGKCVSFCSTCTDAGKQFQTSLGEHGLDAIRAHFSPCACSAKCFGSYNNWPCYFASVGIGTTIPCGGNSPLVPRQDLDVCDPRYIPNNYHCISICHRYNLGTTPTEVWGAGTSCIFCNSFVTASSNLFRNYKIGCTVDTGAGIAYDGSASESGYTCCFCYFVGSSTCGCTNAFMCGTECSAAGTSTICGCTCGCIIPQCYTEIIAVKDHGGGGGSYGGPVSTKIYRIGRCSSVIMTPSGGRGWGDYDTPLIEIEGSTSRLNTPSRNPRIPTWFDTRQAKGSGARGPICMDGIVYSPVVAGAGGGGISGFGNEYASTCVFGGAVCSGTAGPGGGAGGQGVPGTGMVVIYWNP